MSLMFHVVLLFAKSHDVRNEGGNIKGNANERRILGRLRAPNVAQARMRYRIPRMGE